MNRDAYLNSLIGLPWIANAKGPESFDCWHLCVHVERALFARNLADVDIPKNPSWAWMIRACAEHPDHRNWRQVPDDLMGLVRAGDGAIVLMARTDRPAHCGIWLAPEKRILHADPRAGVVFENIASLRMGGWTRLLFYEPKSENMAA